MIPFIDPAHRDDKVILMRSLRFGFFLTLLLAVPSFAQKEAALTLGSVSGPTRTTTSGSTLTLSNAVAFQGSYARQVRTYKYADLYGEVNAVLSPYQSVSGTATSATKDFTALYITPGVRLKFYPKKKLSPWAVGGGGYALYSASSKTIAGGNSAASGTSSNGALEFGGGLDYRWSSRLSFRFEARDFYTGTPHYNLPVSGKGQFNFLAGGGLVFHLGAK